MKVQVIVQPNAKLERIEVQGPGQLKVWVSVPPTEGKANAAVQQALAKHFGVPKSAVTLLSGHKGRRKRFEIATR